MQCVALLSHVLHRVKLQAKQLVDDKSINFTYLYY